MKRITKPTEAHIATWAKDGYKHVGDGVFQCRGGIWHLFADARLSELRYVGQTEHKLEHRLMPP